MKPIVYATTSAGQDVHAITLTAGNISARVLTYGAILNAVHLAGVPYSLTVGSDTFADYETAPYHGALIGPVANRIAGAAAPVAGKIHRFEANEHGKQTLHSGRAATSRKVWRIDDTAGSSATLRLDLPDGEGGFPGHRTVIARYEVRAPGTLRLTVTVTSDAATLVNFANHSYWNLDGTPDWNGHRLRIAADSYLPVNGDTIPTGEIADVTGTGFDFRTERALVRNAPPLDHNLCLSDAPTRSRDVLGLTGATGITMTMATTAPGMQVYDGQRGRIAGGPFYQALAFEPQGWPDAPNHPHFPQITYGPGNDFHQISEWRFTCP